MSCRVESCHRAAKVRGVCMAHYQALKKSGDPDGVLLPPWSKGVPHGKMTGYRHHGCRCELCVAAERNYQREYNKKNPHRQRGRHLRYTYGIDIADYNRMADEQAGACAICKTTEAKLYVDHSHESGVVRGLLCQKCNSAIGMLKDDPQMVRRAYTYLLKHLFRSDAA